MNLKKMGIMARDFNPTKFRAAVCVALKRMGDVSSPESGAEMIDNFMSGLRLVAGRELNNKALRKELIALYQCRLIPYFDLRTTRRLLDRRKSSPRYLVNLVLFVNTLRIEFKSVWALLHAFTPFDGNEAPQVFRARMIFLRIILNKLDGYTMANEGFRKLLNAIGQARIERQAAQVIIQGVEHYPEHGLNTLFYWLNEACAKGQKEDEFLQIFNFCNGVLIEYQWGGNNMPYKAGSFHLGPTVLCLTPQLRHFISILEEASGQQVPLMFRRNGFENLYVLYLLNPKLFERVAPLCARADCSYTFYETYMDAVQMNRLLAHQFWCHGLTPKAFQWFKCLYQGKGLVGRKDLPVTMTRKAVQRFRTLRADNDLTVRQQLILAQVMQTGVDDVSYATLIVDGMGPRRKADYLVEAMHNLYVRGLPANEVRNVMDYLKAKFDEARVNVKEKKLATLIRDAERWHDLMNQLREARWGSYDYYWENNTDFRLKRSEIEYRCFDHNGIEYAVKQLLRATELVREGEAMNHCIASYARDCRYGHAFIFSLCQTNGLEQSPLLTLEVRGRSLVQARGFANRLPTELEFDVIRLWAGYAGVHLRL
jgi:hypothetical protein